MKFKKLVCAVLLALVVTNPGCRTAEVETSNAEKRKSATTKRDECQIAVWHYEKEDLPNPELLLLFEQLVQKGDVRGTMWIARFYDLGRVSMLKRPDIAQEISKEVITDIAKLARSGDVEAQFLLGAAYQKGLGVDRDLEKAVNWYVKAANAGQMTAMNNLGFMLAYGHGIEPDINKARLWFSRSAGLGSVAASRNVMQFSNGKRNNPERFRRLRSVALVQALGMKKEKGIQFLANKGLISDTEGYEKADYKELKLYRFRNDGVVLGVDVSGRITDVEGHVKDSIGPKQFRGEIPLGLTWKSTGNSILDTLGEEDDHGWVKDDQGYGFAYEIENVIFVPVISYSGDSTLKLWRVHERWASKYSTPELAGDNK